MESNIRFRNHFSMVLPNLKGILWIVFMAFLSAVTEENPDEVLQSILMWITLIILLVVYQIIIWAKTWISIGEQSIVIERNTLVSRRKNTIGIANISNINLEQNLMAMLFGTCKLKLDTNSLSTAESTDVTIVLKKAKAEEVKRLLLNRIEGNTEAISEVQVTDEGISNVKAHAFKQDACSLRIGGKDIILHGLYSSQFLYAMFVPFLVLLEIVSEFAGEQDFEAIIDGVGTFAAETTGLGVLVIILIIAWALLAMIISLVRNAVRYWDFVIDRQNNKLVLNYGLTKKVNYSIPIDKIQAVVLKQTFFARLCKRYMVEVVNVGMNDDQKEAQSFLLPYGKKSDLKEQLQQLLPEFAEYLDMEAQRQPKTIWLVWLWPVLVYAFIAIAILGTVIEFIPGFLGIVSGGVGVISIAFLLTQVAGYFTQGTCFANQVLFVVNGSFSRKYVFIKYDNIQYVSLKQNFIAKRFDIQRGTVHLLASSQNQVQEIPYFRGEQEQILQSRLSVMGNIRCD